MSEAAARLRRSFRSLGPTRLAQLSPWAVGAGFALSLLGVFALTRASMLAVAARQEYLKGLNREHVLWLGPALGYDLLLAVLVACSIAVPLRYVPRIRPLVLAFGYVFIVFADIVCVVSVPTYSALHTTLQATQLLLAGGVKDLFDTGLDVVSPLGLAMAVAILLASLAVVPTLAAWAERAFGAFAPKRTKLVVLMLALVLFVPSTFAPADGAAGLEDNPVGVFLASALRYARRRSDLSRVDMRDAPHFDTSPIAAKGAKAEPLDGLMNTRAMPLQNANVILFVLESASVNQFSLWNGKDQTTPRLTELSKHALMFDNYYTVSPVSMKSLFTLSCSSYPYPHPQAETYVNPSMECMSISEILKSKGYRTGLFHSGNFSYTKKDDFFKYRKLDVMRDAKTLVNRAKYPSVPWGADDRAAVDDALEWLEQDTSNKPFFMDLVFLAPHHPYTLNRKLPQPYGTKTDLDRYRNATLFVDSQIGRVWDWLVAKGKADDTLLVVVGDHGEAFGEHPGHFTHGTRIYDEVMRTPMMLINPQLFTGKRSARIGNHVDLVPTVLDLLGLPAQPRHQGKSLLNGYRPRTIYFYADWWRHLLGLRDGQWKFIYDVDRDRPELYDLARDKHERKNVAALHEEQVAKYRDRVLSWEGFYRELIPNYENYVVSGGGCPGRKTCYLDELKPVLQRGDLRRKRSLGGDVLRVGKRTATRGLGVAPLSILRYNIHGQGFHTLKGAVGHHVQGRNANLSLKVSAEIYLDDELVWSSGKLTADENPRDFSVDVEDGSVLELIGYDVDGETWRDYMDWLDVRLER